jgi:hypothetical protein
LVRCKVGKLGCAQDPPPKEEWQDVLADDNGDIGELGKLLCDGLEEDIIKTEEADPGARGFMTAILSSVVIVVL